MHPNPSPNPNSGFSSSSQNPPFSLPFPHGNADPQPASNLKPPGVHPYSSLTQSSAFTYDASYYFDPNSHTWPAKGPDSTAYVGAINLSVAQEAVQNLAVLQPASALWNNFVFQPQGNKNVNKRQKRTKVVQSAYCEVCKIDCNSKDVLDNHKVGKKHKKKLEKLLAGAAGPGVSSVVSHHPIGPQLNPNKVTPAKKKATKSLEDLETKRRKIVEGGAAQEAVRVCAICNVVCNSQGVYNLHLAGKKHATMVNKYMGGVSLVAGT